MELTTFTDLATYNERIEKIWGKHIVKNVPLYRIVWSDNQTERRMTFDVLGNSKEIAEVPKYPWLYNAFVVEKMIANPHIDVYDGDYIYNVFYAFQIFPSWEAIEKLLNKVEKRDIVGRGQIEIFTGLPRSKVEMDYKEENRIALEKQRTRDMIDTTVLETSLNDKSAMSYSNTDGIDFRPSQQDKKNEI